MKKLFLGIAALTALVIMGCSESKPTEGKFKLSANLKGYGDSVIVMRIDPMTMETLNVDTIPAKDNKLDLVLDLKGVETLYAVSFANGKPNTNVSFNIPAMPGEEVVVEGDSVEFHVTGSEFYKDFENATMALDPAMKKVMALNKECDEKMQKGESEEAIGKYYEEKVAEYQNELSDAALNYIKQYPNQEASAYLITTLGVKMEDGLKLLGKDVQNGRASVLYKGIMENMKKQKMREERADKLEGSEAPDFTLNDINGKPLALNSLRGKYLILDFWGSWCGWCIKGMPKMKEYYAKYKNKLEILGVDCNDSEEKWKAAVEKEQLPWLHVYNPKGNENDPCDLYAVQGYPTKVVIDPNGKITKVIVGEDPAFYEYLDSLLK